MNLTYSLSQLRPGEKARVRALSLHGSMRRRLLDIGLVEDTEVECLGTSPGGDPCAYAIRGAVIAIRREDGRHILVEPMAPRGGEQGEGAQVHWA